jgi:hypothetical protein
MVLAPEANTGGECGACPDHVEGLTASRESVGGVND